LRRRNNKQWGSKESEEQSNSKPQMNRELKSIMMLKVRRKILKMKKDDDEDELEDYKYGMVCCPN